MEMVKYLVTIAGLLFSNALFAATDEVLLTYNPVNSNASQLIQPPSNGSLFLQPPNQSNASFSDHDCQVCIIYGEASVADNFILQQATEVGSVRFWGGYGMQNIPVATDRFDILIHADNGGLPGAVLYQVLNIPADQRTVTGATLFGLSEYEYRIEFPQNVQLAAGTYWIEIINNTVGSGESWFWEIGDLDAVNGILNHAYSRSAPGVNWTPDPFDQEMAFELIEAQREVFDSVPVPTLGMWGLGLLVLLLGGMGYRARTRA